MERKLAAVLSLAVKGYSRRMGEDEVATIHTLTAYPDRRHDHRGGARRKKRRSSSARLSVTCVGRPCGQA
jgi:hypothetical protein